mmetsp:Transcript_29938/g.57523  ORF Transcript_29938/g.57523 Transcript_29938/m.57523 type:complete len:134 (-) Transcript_29938:299-700(-)
MAVNSTGQGRHRHWIVCCLAASPGRNWKGRQELQEMASQEIQEAIAAEVRRDPQPFQSENHPTIYFPHHEMVEGLEEGRFEDWSAPARCLEALCPSYHLSPDPTRSPRVVPQPPPEVKGGVRPLESKWVADLA